MGLKKYGIQTNYKPGSGDKALDAAIEAIKKDFQFDTKLKNLSKLKI